jgi:bis(5'-adenosyl)-triphosphatase
MVQQQDVQPLRVDADEHRLPRSMNEMEREAEWLRSFFD